MNAETEQLIKILASEVRTFVRAELEQSRVQLRAEMVELYHKRIALLERDLGIEGK